MAAKPFASSADLAAKEQTLEVLADGVYALTAEGDPNVGAIEGEDFLVCFEAIATPSPRALARPAARAHRQAGALPGAVALPRRAGTGRQRVRRRRDRHAREDPRAHRRARQAGLGVGVRPHAAAGRASPTRCPASPGRRSRSPTASPSTSAATVATWCCSTAAAATPRATSSAGCRSRRSSSPATSSRPQAALYTGDAFHRDWASSTLDRVAAIGAEALIGGRGAVEPRRGGRRGGDRADPRTSST